MFNTFAVSLELLFLHIKMNIIITQAMVFALLAHANQRAFFVALVYQIVQKQHSPKTIIANLKLLSLAIKTKCGHGQT